MENTIIKDLNVEGTDHGLVTESIEKTEPSEEATNLDQDDDLPTNRRNLFNLITGTTTTMKTKAANAKHSKSSGKDKQIERICDGKGKERQLKDSKHIHNLDLSTQHETLSGS